MVSLTQLRSIAKILALIFVLGFSLNGFAGTLVVSKEGGNFSSIQQAVEAAEPGEDLLIKEGTYKENLKIDKDLTLRGQGKVRVEGSKKGWPVILIGPSAAKVAVINCVLRGASAKICQDREKGLCPSGLSAVGQSQVVLRNSAVKENGLDGIWLKDSARITIETSEVKENERYGVWLLNSTEATIKNSSILNNKNGLTLAGSSSLEMYDGSLGSNRHGASLFGSAQLTMEDSRVGKNEKTGLRSYNDAAVNLIDNAIVDNRGQGITLWDTTSASLKGNLLEGNEIGLANYSSGEIKFQNNTIVDNLIDLIGDLQGDWRQRSAQPAADKIVLPDDDYPDLQSAVDALYPGGLLILKDDLRGGAVIDKKLTIRGEEDEARLTLSGKGPAPVLSLIDGAELDLERVTVAGSGAEGIILGGDAELTLKESKVRQNGGDGIDLWDSGSLISADSEIRDNGGSGVRLVESTRSKVKNCEITGNELYGLLLAGSSRLSAKNNGIEKNGRDAISIGASARGEIEGNDILRNEGSGLRLYSSAQATVSANRFEHNTTGISLGDSSRVTLRGNRIAANKTGIRVLQPDEFQGALAGHGNRITQNGTDFDGIANSVEERLTRSKS